MIFVQDPPLKERDKKACEKNNHPVGAPGQAGIWLIFRGLFFEHNAACPVVAIAKTEDWAKRLFMDGH